MISSTACSAAADTLTATVVGVGELNSRQTLAVPAQFSVSATVALISCKAAMFCALLVINLTFSTRAAGQLGVESCHSFPRQWSAELCHLWKSGRAHHQHQSGMTFSRLIR